MKIERKWRNRKNMKVGHDTGTGVEVNYCLNISIAWPSSGGIKLIGENIEMKPKFHPNFFYLHFQTSSISCLYHKMP